MDYPRTPEHNILRALPFFLLFLLLALMGWAGYRGYKSAHPKPTEHVSVTIRPVDQPFGMQCNSGVFVTDLSDCAEYHGSGWDRLHFAFTHQPRKHKRKPDELFAYLGHGGWHDDPRYQVYEEFRFINTLPMELSCTKRTKTSGMKCESRPLTPAEIDQYKPMTEKKKPDCPAAPSGDGDYYVDSDGCLRVSFTPMPLTCGADEECRWSVAHVTPDKSKPAHAETNGGGPCGEAICDWPDHPERVKRLVPDCKMPADVDVCPTHQLDPKAEDDRKEKARASLVDAMITCALTPEASPTILLKSGPEPVPCATLKWAADSVEADKKKGISEGVIDLRKYGVHD